jgi:signal peptidase I
MTTTEEPAEPTRKVRPVFAALLTFVSLGLGFYYARQTKTAIYLLIATALISVAAGIALLFSIYAGGNPLGISGDLTTVDNAGHIVGLVCAAAVAIWAWISTTRKPVVKKAGPVRLLGYVGIVVVPLLIALAIAMVLRWLAFQPFRNPSGSMQPTISIGAGMLVSKSAYGYSAVSFAPFEDFIPVHRSGEPARGDIVVLRPPYQRTDYVKRVIGLPGDHVGMINGVLSINGQPVKRELAATTPDPETSEPIRVFRETLPNGASYLTYDRVPSGKLDNMPDTEISPGHYFVLGDDRDNSVDSRVETFGSIPVDRLVGKVIGINNVGSSRAELD